MLTVSPSATVRDSSDEKAEVPLSVPAPELLAEPAVDELSEVPEAPEENCAAANTIAMMAATGIAAMSTFLILLREASLLHVDAEALYRPFCTLSNGEQTKLLLAGLFLKEGNLVTIDF